MKRIRVFYVLTIFCLLFTACNQPSLSNKENSYEENKDSLEDINKESNVNTDDKNTAELDVIEKVYPLSFEEIKTPMKKFEELEVINWETIEEVIMEEVFDKYTFIIYSKKDEDNQDYVGFLIEGNFTDIYEIGKIGYQPNLIPYHLEKVNLFNKNYLVIRGICGANCPITYYVDIYNDEVPSLFLGMEANGTETDISGDGINELIATVGTHIETTVYIEENGHIFQSERFAIPDTVQVFYNKDDNKFHIAFKNKKLGIYEYKDKQLHFVQLKEW